MRKTPNVKDLMNPDIMTVADQMTTDVRRMRSARARVRSTTSITSAMPRGIQ